ncbi:hypothetical protein [Archaeoglobus sp.]
MLVLFTSHRVEMLKHFEEIAKDYDTIVIEEPKDSLFERMLKGDITIDYYVENLNTSFPLYSTYQCEVLRRLYSMGKKIYQVEPYLEVLEKIHRAIESKQPLPSDELSMKVRVVEKKVGSAWVDYQEAFMKRDFDALVDSAVRFTKADAERFIVRDEMRAEEVAKIGDCLVEAGQIHILLPEILKEKGFDVKVVDLPREVANKLGIEFYLNPGNELTIKYMLGEDVGDEEARLMCAQSIIYVSLIPKDELLPSDDDPYPHLKRECRIAKKVRKLSYEECKELFHRIWVRRSL